MAARVKVVPRPAGLAQQLYVPAIAEAMWVTFRHFGRNFFWSLFSFGNAEKRRARSHIVTVQYPEEKKPYPARHRGLHRLMVRDDGQVRCVACMMCPTVCPAHCITIVPEESSDSRIEKRPRIFEIDELRCVVCGLCVEACPCDAIRMDTGRHAPPVYHRSDAILERDELLTRADKSTAVQGGAGAFWREKVTGENQTPPAGDVVPAGAPRGPVPITREQ